MHAQNSTVPMGSFAGYAMGAAPCTLLHFFSLMNPLGTRCLALEVPKRAHF